MNPLQTHFPKSADFLSKTCAGIVASLNGSYHIFTSAKGLQEDKLASYVSFNTPESKLILLLFRFERHLHSSEDKATLDDLATFFRALKSFPAEVKAYLFQDDDWASLLMSVTMAVNDPVCWDRCLEYFRQLSNDPVIAQHLQQARRFLNKKYERPFKVKGVSESMAFHSPVRDLLNHLLETQDTGIYEIRSDDDPVEIITTFYDRVNLTKRLMVVCKDNEHIRRLHGLAVNAFFPIFKQFYCADIRNTSFLRQPDFRLFLWRWVLEIAQHFDKYIEAYGEEYSSELLSCIHPVLLFFGASIDDGIQLLADEMNNIAFFLYKRKKFSQASDLFIYLANNIRAAHRDKMQAVASVSQMNHLIGQVLECCDDEARALTVYQESKAIKFCPSYSQHTSEMRKNEPLRLGVLLSLQALVNQSAKLTNPQLMQAFSSMFHFLIKLSYPENRRVFQQVFDRNQSDLALAISKKEKEVARQQRQQKKKNSAHTTRAKTRRSKLAVSDEHSSHDKKPVMPARPSSAASVKGGLKNPIHKAGMFKPMPTISRASIPQALLSLIDTLQSTNTQHKRSFHLTGSTVIDLIKGNKPNDYDILVFGFSEAELCLALDALDISWEIRGKKHRIIFVQLLDGELDIDFSIAPKGDGRDKILKADHDKRDFELTSLYVELILEDDMPVFAHKGVIKRVREQKIKMIGDDPYQRLTQDLTRVFRLIKLILRYPNHKVHGDLRQAVQKIADNWGDVIKAYLKSDYRNRGRLRTSMQKLIMKQGIKDVGRKLQELSLFTPLTGVQYQDFKQALAQVPEHTEPPCQWVIWLLVLAKQGKSRPSFDAYIHMEHYERDYMDYMICLAKKEEPLCFVCDDIRLFSQSLVSNDTSDNQLSCG